MPLSPRSVMSFLARSRWSIDSGCEMLVRYGVVGEKNRTEKDKKATGGRKEERRGQWSDITIDKALGNSVKPHLKKGEENNTHDSRSLSTPRKKCPCKKTQGCFMPFPVGLFFLSKSGCP